MKHSALFLAVSAAAAENKRKLGSASYTDPLSWASDAADPNVCKAGKFQSPIYVDPNFVTAKSLTNDNNLSQQYSAQAVAATQNAATNGLGYWDLIGDKSANTASSFTVNGKVAFNHMAMTTFDQPYHLSTLRIILVQLVKYHRVLCRS